MKIETSGAASMIWEFLVCNKRKITYIEILEYTNYGRRQGGKIEVKWNVCKACNHANIILV